MYYVNVYIGITCVFVLGQNNCDLCSALDVEDSREVFYEGAFLNMLFKKLQRLLDQVCSDK